MKKSDKLAVLLFLKKSVQKIQEKNIGASAYTCHMVEKKYGFDSEELDWYKYELSKFYETYPDVVDLMEDHNKESFEDGFWNSPFDGEEYKDRLLLLNTLIDKYKN